MNTLIIIIEQCLLYLPLILGGYCSLFLMKLPDLSIEAAYVFGALCAVKSIEYLGLLTPAGFFLGSGIAAIAGAAVGFLVSFLSQKCKMPYLLSAIVCIGLFQGIYQILLGSSHYTLTTAKGLLAFMPVLAQFPELYTLGVVALLALSLLLLFLKTRLGVACAVYGDNPGFFKNYGISTSYVMIAGVMVSNAFAGVSGYCVALMNGFVDSSMGFGIPLLAITALMLGAYIVRSSKPIHVLIPCVGVIAYIALQQLLVTAGLGSRYFTMIQAAVVLVVICFRARSSKISVLQNQGEC